MKIELRIDDYDLFIDKVDITGEVLLSYNLKSFLFTLYSI